MAGSNSHISTLEGIANLKQRNMITVHLPGLEFNADFPLPATGYPGPGNILKLRKTRQDFFAYSSQFMIIVMLRVKRQVDNRNIINLNRFDHPSAYNGRHLINMHINLIMQLN